MLQHQCQHLHKSSQTCSNILINISKEHVQCKNIEKFSDHHEEHQDKCRHTKMGAIQHRTKQLQSKCKQIGIQRVQIYHFSPPLATKYANTTRVLHCMYTPQIKDVQKEKIESTSHNTDDQASSCRKILNLPFSFSNCLASKVLVKMSVSCSSVSTAHVSQPFLQQDL